MSRTTNRRWQAMKDAMQNGTAHNPKTPAHGLIKGAEQNLIGGLVSLLRHEAQMREPDA